MSFPIWRDPCRIFIKEASKPPGIALRVSAHQYSKEAGQDEKERGDQQENTRYILRVAVSGVTVVCAENASVICGGNGVYPILLLSFTHREDIVFTIAQRVRIWGVISISGKPGDRKRLVVSGCIEHPGSTVLFRALIGGKGGAKLHGIGGEFVLGRPEAGYGHDGHENATSKYEHINDQIQPRGIQISIQGILFGLKYRDIPFILPEIRLVGICNELVAPKGHAVKSDPAAPAAQHRVAAFAGDPGNLPIVIGALYSKQVSCMKS